MDRRVASTDRAQAPAGLPPPVAGTHVAITSLGAHVQAYVAGQGPPMLLVHSINAAASAAEVQPLLEHYRRTHTVVCIDLPGFGWSAREERLYTPEVMVAAVLEALQAIGQRCPGERVHVLGVSLGCEYVARAALQAPDRIASVALVSPTGMTEAWPRGDPAKGHLGRGWMRAAFGGGRGRAVFRALTRPAVIRYFLRRTWGSRQIDPGLLAYDVQTVRVPGAHHAPLCFISGYLFSADIGQVYDQLAGPVWVCHGVRGDFTRYDRLRRYALRPNWRVAVLPTGALPQFEALPSMTAAWDAFRAAVAGER